MRVIRRILLGGLLAVGAGCGSEVVEPGALTITVSATPPSPTSDPSLTITGQVTRTPAALGIPIAVTLSHGGGTATDSAGQDGGFTFTIALTPNAENQLQLTAADASGSTATPLTLTVVHDGEGPRVLQVSPATGTDGVTSGVIQVTLNEKLDELVGAGIVVSRQGTPVAGTVVISTDSLTLTFTAAAPLVSNSIHQITVGNYRDALGNLGTGVAACIVSGGTPTTFADPAADAVYVSGTPGAALAAPDLTEIRVHRVSGDLLWILRFASPKSLDINSPNNFLAWLDLDLDEDGGTGFATVKDTLLGALLPPSGARVEYAIAVGSVAAPTDSSVAGILSDWGTIPTAGAFAFVPDICGPFVGFLVPLSALGADDGGLRVVSFLQSGDATGLRADAAPDGGFYDVNLLGPLQAAVSRAPLPRPDALPRGLRFRDWRRSERQK